jgi:hypothetical protein
MPELYFRAAAVIRGILLTCAGILTGLLSSVLVVAASAADVNQVILKAIQSMPSGGSYSLGSGNANVARATWLTGSQLMVDPSAAEPTHCSSATYVLLLKTLLNPALGLNLDLDTEKALLPRQQGDGVGIWGRWNANGPGTAALFHELNLGNNFTDIGLARPGDFMKVSWNGIIGSDPRIRDPNKNEKGHSAIFLGSWKDSQGKVWVDFWTSNSAGYIYRHYPPKSRVEGVDFVEMSKVPSLEGYSYRTAPYGGPKAIAFIIFSRLSRPGNITMRSNLPVTNKYLADLTKRHSSREEEAAQCGIPFEK